jgi:hypothetical protein
MSDEYHLALWQVKDILIVYFDSFKEQVIILVISPVSMLMKFDVDRYFAWKD